MFGVFHLPRTSLKAPLFRYHTQPDPVALFRCTLCGDEDSYLFNILNRTARKHKLKPALRANYVEIDAAAREQIQETANQCFPKFFVQ
jgi:hypothetical protein